MPTSSDLLQWGTMCPATGRCYKGLLSLAQASLCGSATSFKAHCDIMPECDSHMLKFDPDKSNLQAAAASCRSLLPRHCRILLQASWQHVAQVLVVHDDHSVSYHWLNRIVERKAKPMTRGCQPVGTSGTCACMGRMFLKVTHGAPQMLVKLAPACCTVHRVTLCQLHYQPARLPVGASTKCLVPHIAAMYAAACHRDSLSANMAIANY